MSLSELRGSRDRLRKPSHTPSVDKLPGAAQTLARSNQRAMKQTKILLASFGVTFLTLAFAGCAAMSGQKPATKFENVLFTTQTNYVDKVVEVPKTVWVTNMVQRTVTNAQNVVVTNVVPQFKVQYLTVTETQSVPAYTFQTRTNVVADVQTVGAIVNTFVPGLGGLISGGLLAGLSLWRRLRSYKAAATAADQTSGVLVQNIAAIRDFIKQVVPDGQNLDQAMVQYLASNQDKLGAIDQVASLIQHYVKSHQTRTDVQELRNALTSLTTATKP